jgi:hypothetical protein
MTATDFRDALMRLPLGESLTYAIGNVARDAEPKKGAENNDLAALRDAVWERYENGKIVLTQRKLKDGVYEYRAVRVNWPPVIIKRKTVKQLEAAQ